MFAFHFTSKNDRVWAISWSHPETFNLQVRISRVRQKKHANFSVQAENKNLAHPTFLKDFDLNFHMPGYARDVVLTLDT